MDGKIPLIVILGPTATGKTALSIDLAKKYSGEIISADSMQVYKGMDIATAKPSKEETCGIPHHLMSILEPDERFSVADFKALAEKTICEITSRGKLPIVVGGTGLYIDSLVNNITFASHPTDLKLRAQLEDEYKTCGGEAMLDRLKQLDPDFAAALHPNNRTRIIRGIEIYLQTGKTMSEHIAESRKIPSPYNACIIGLSYESRDMLYEAINKRVDKMVEEGLIEEAREFYHKGTKGTSAQAIGIKELFPYFKGEISLDEAIEKIKMETRRYAKRQLTWFRRNKDINWILKNKDTSQKNVFEKAKNTIEKMPGLCYTCN